MFVSVIMGNRTNERTNEISLLLSSSGSRRAITRLGRSFARIPSVQLQSTNLNGVETTVQPISNFAHLHDWHPVAKHAKQLVILLIVAAAVPRLAIRGYSKMVNRELENTDTKSLMGTCSGVQGSGALRFGWLAS